MSASTDLLARIDRLESTEAIRQLAAQATRCRSTCAISMRT
jgi:hypothetical protein